MFFIRIFLLLALLVYPTYGYTSINESHSGSTSKQNSHTEKTNSEQNPLFVQVIPSESAKQAASHKAEQEENKFWYDKILAYATLLLAIFTFGLFIATYRLAKDAKRTSERQAAEMQNSIAQAARSAAAMEGVANITERNSKLMEANWRRQMRAYISVIIGSAIFQERGKNLKFEAKPRMLNTGHTPAHNVRFSIKAAILPVILPDDFTFPLTNELGGNVIGPNQFNDISGTVDEFIPDQDVNNTKHAAGRVLHVWGIVHYDDVFGEHHITRFCQALTWIGEGANEIVYGYYNSRHNDAT